MKSLIIYGSQYGTTKRYAETFSQMSGIPAVSYQTIPSLTGCELIFHFGGLYAGHVKGLPSTLKSCSPDTRLVIVTVGLADTSDEKNTNAIKKAVLRQLPKSFLSHVDIFHLRGGIDYSKLKMTHKVMMTLLYHKAKALPDEQKTGEIQAMIETFNQKVDFTDYHTLKPLFNLLPEPQELSPIFQGGQ